MATNDVQVDAEIDREGSTSVEPPNLPNHTKGDRQLSPAPPQVGHQMGSGTETEHLKYLKFMPINLQEDIIEILIICAKEDTEKAKCFRDDIKGIEINIHGHVRPVTAKLLDDFIDGSGDTLDLAFSKAIYVFLYVTEEFCECSSTILKSNACLKEALDDEEKRWCVVPVYTKPKAERNFKLPGKMNGLNEFEWNGNKDRRFAEFVKNLLEANTGHILERQSKLDKERKQYFEERKLKIQECVEFQEQKRRAGRQSDETAVKRIMSSRQAAPASTPLATGAQNTTVEQKDCAKDCQGFPDHPRGHYSFE